MVDDEGASHGFVRSLLLTRLRRFLNVIYGETIAELQQTGQFTPEHFEKAFEITGDMLEVYYKFAKFQYECGEYGKCYEMLSNYLNLTQSGTTTATGGAAGGGAAGLGGGGRAGGGES